MRRRHEDALQRTWLLRPHARRRRQVAAADNAGRRHAVAVRFAARRRQVVAEAEGVEIDALALVRDGRSETDDTVRRRSGGGSRRGGVLRELMMMVGGCVRICVVDGRGGRGGCRP